MGVGPPGPDSSCAWNVPGGCDGGDVNSGGGGNGDVGGYEPDHKPEGDRSSRTKLGNGGSGGNGVRVVH